MKGTNLLETLIFDQLFKSLCNVEMTIQIIVSKISRFEKSIVSHTIRGRLWIIVIACE
jgi:hypothetical protein